MALEQGIYNHNCLKKSRCIVAKSVGKIWDNDPKDLSILKLEKNRIKLGIKVVVSPFVEVLIKMSFWKSFYHLWPLVLIHISPIFGVKMLLDFLIYLQMSQKHQLLKSSDEKGHCHSTGFFFFFFWGQKSLPSDGNKAESLFNMGQRNISCRSNFRELFFLPIQMWPTLWFTFYFSSPNTHYYSCTRTYVLSGWLTVPAY